MNHKDRVLRQFLEAFEQLFITAEAYPLALADEPGAVGEWSARQVVAHLSGWLAEALQRYDAFEAGDVQNRHYDHDAFNAQSVQTRAGQSWAVTLGELHGLVDVFRFRVLRLSRSAFEKDARYLEWLDAMTVEATQHTADLEAFRRVQQP